MLKVMLLEALAFWPVWNWYWQRLNDGSDDPWCIAALLTAIALHRKVEATPRIPYALLAGYIAAALWGPMILRALFAIAAIAYTLGRMQPGAWGLLALSVPLLASLQFYCGYPLRAFVAILAAAQLRMGGLAVLPSGSGLLWGAQQVEIDAPCSGIKMLWAGLYLAFTLAAVHRLDWRRTMQAAAFAAVLVIAANILRSTALFYTEAGLIPMPHWAHAGAGVTVFAAAAIFFTWKVRPA